MRKSTGYDGLRNTQTAIVRWNGKLLLLSEHHCSVDFICGTVFVFRGSAWSIKLMEYWIFYLFFYKPTFYIIFFYISCHDQNKAVYK